MVIQMVREKKVRQFEHVVKAREPRQTQSSNEKWRGRNHNATKSMTTFVKEYIGGISQTEMWMVPEDHKA